MSGLQLQGVSRRLLVHRPGMSPARALRARRRVYDKLHREDPIAANTWLLLLELADERGRVLLGHQPEAEIAQLLARRFPDPAAYQLPRPRRGAHR